MEIKEIRSKINKILADFGLTADKMYLFGSRAGKRYDRFSDYDILVVVSQNISVETKKMLSKKIRSTFAQFHVDMDILIKSSKEVKKSQFRTGNVVKQAISEGILL